MTAHSKAISDEPSSALIYSRSSAIIGTFSLVAGWFGTLLAGASLALIALGAKGRPESILAGATITALSVFIIQIQDAETLDDRRLRPWHGRRPKWLLGSFSIVLIAIHMLVIDWRSAMGDGFSLEDLIGLLGFAFLGLLSALFMAALCELLLQAGRLVLKQLRGWRKLPFEGWSPSDISRLVTTSDFGRWPNPANSSLSTEEAQAYALLASYISNRRWVVGQLLVLIASGGLGTSLASWTTWETDKFGQYAALVSLSIGAIGLRLSLISVQTWEKRAAAYRDFAKTAKTSTNRVHAANAPLAVLRGGYLALSIPFPRFLNQTQRRLRKQHNQSMARPPTPSD